MTTPDRYLDSRAVGDLVRERLASNRDAQSAGPRNLADLAAAMRVSASTLRGVLGGHGRARLGVGGVTVPALASALGLDEEALRAAGEGES